MKHKSITLNNLHVRYDSETGEIILTSKDPLVKKKPFILTLTGDSPTYKTLFELLQQAGLVDLECPSIAKTIVIPNARATDSRQGDFKTRIRIGETFLDEPVELNLANSPHTLVGGVAGSGKSVFQRLVAAHALLHHEEIDFYAIDLKYAELKSYFKDSPEKFARTLDEALNLLEELKGLVQKRCNALGTVGETSSSESKAIYLMVDELGTLLHGGGEKTAAGQLENAKRSLIREKLLYLARLGQAAGLHLFIGAQRLGTEVNSGELMGLFTNRILMGGAGSQAAQLILGERAKFGGALLGNPGRAIVSVLSEQKLTQIYYLDERSVERTH